MKPVGRPWKLDGDVIYGDNMDIPVCEMSNVTHKEANIKLILDSVNGPIKSRFIVEDSFKIGFERTYKFLVVATLMSIFVSINDGRLYLRHYNEEHANAIELVAMTRQDEFNKKLDDKYEAQLQDIREKVRFIEEGLNERDRGSDQVPSKGN